MIISTFTSLNLSDDLLQILKKEQITEPTPIQQQAIPAALDGKDIIAQSQTGTGKTLAYLLPILEKIDVHLKEVQAVVLVPTRELGAQILGEMETYGTGNGVLAQSLIGGAAIGRQVEKLRLHPQIVVGTPGRVLELIKTRKLKMHLVRTIVVDEVDQVFELGGIKEVEGILKSALGDRQILFFSATLSPAIEQAAQRWMREPMQIRIEPTQRTAPTLEHLYFVSERREKIDTLRRLARLYNPQSALVFINEIDHIAELVAKLQHAGLSVEALYGEAGKLERTQVLKRFREGRFQLLLATDVAARGLDIKGLTHVINFDLPIDSEHYVHRAGRTGRMGRSGTVISIVIEQEKFIIDKFEKKLDIEISHKAMYQGKVFDPAEGRFAGGRRMAGKPGMGARADRAGNGAAKSRPAGDSKPTAVSGASGAKRSRAAKVQATAPKQAKANRERDRKNKGAPKWLKVKQTNDQS